MTGWMTRFRTRTAGAPTSVMGIDLGLDELRAVHVDHRPNPPVLLGLTRRAWAQGEHPAEPLRSAVTELRGEHARCVVAVGGPNVLVRPLTSSATDAADLMRGARQLVREQLRFELDQVVFDHDHSTSAASSPSDSRSRFVAVARRDQVEALVSVVRAAGLSVDVVEVESLALHNLFVRSHPETCEGHAALLHVARGTACLNLTDEGRLVHTQQLMTGRVRLPSEPTTESAIDVVELSTRFERALAGLGSAGGAPLTPGPGAPGGQGSPGTPTGMVRPGRLFVAGPGVRTPGLLDELANRSRIETRPARPMGPFAPGREVLHLSQLESQLPHYFLALGLALRIR